MDKIMHTGTYSHVHIHTLLHTTHGYTHTHNTHTTTHTHHTRMHTHTHTHTFCVRYADTFSSSSGRIPVFLRHTASITNGRTVVRGMGSILNVQSGLIYNTPTFLVCVCVCVCVSNSQLLTQSGCHSIAQ